MIWMVTIIILLVIRLVLMQFLTNSKNSIIKELEYDVKTLDEALDIQSDWCKELQEQVDYYKQGMDEVCKENIDLKKKISNLNGK